MPSSDAGDAVLDCGKPPAQGSTNWKVGVATPRFEDLISDNHRLRITEDTPNTGPGDEAREAVQVEELLEFGHRPSMTRIPPEGKSDLFGKSRGFSGC